MVYVSTAYTNVDKLESREVIYPQDYQPDDIINMVNTLSDDALEKVFIFVRSRSKKTFFSKFRLHPLFLDVCQTHTHSQNHLLRWQLPVKLKNCLCQ